MDIHRKAWNFFDLGIILKTEAMSLWYKYEKRIESCVLWEVQPLFYSHPRRLRVLGHHGSSYLYYLYSFLQLCSSDISRSHRHFLAEEVSQIIFFFHSLQSVWNTVDKRRASLVFKMSIYIYMSAYVNKYTFDVCGVCAITTRKTSL